MKAEQLVPSLETCKKLKDFPETYFFYVHKPQFKKYILGNRNMFFDYDELSNPLPAPTVSELLEVLPRRTTIEKNNGFFVYGEAYSPACKVSGDNPAEALALLYIELKEKGVIFGWAGIKSEESDDD